MGRAVRSPVSLLGMGTSATRPHMIQWHDEDVQCLDLAQLGDRYRRYRFTDADAETAMAGSLRRYGQLSPLVVCLREESTRSSTVSSVWPRRGRSGLKTLTARLLEADERVAKAAIYGLNDTGRRPHEWEEAWIVHALVREDGMTQIEVADLLGRHKSWVCRRLALVEKLAGEAREDLRLGLLSGTAARSLVRLPAGNQGELLATLHRDELTAHELDGVVDLLLAAPGQSQQQYILAQPRQALTASRHESGWAWDPRLSPTGNRLAKRLSDILESLGRIESLAAPSGTRRADSS